MIKQKNTSNDIYYFIIDICNFLWCTTASIARLSLKTRRKVVSFIQQLKKLKPFNKGNNFVKWSPKNSIKILLREIKTFLRSLKILWLIISLRKRLLRILWGNSKLMLLKPWDNIRKTASQLRDQKRVLKYQRKN